METFHSISSSEIKASSKVKYCSLENSVKNCIYATVPKGSQSVVSRSNIYGQSKEEISSELDHSAHLLVVHANI